MMRLAESAALKTVEVGGKKELPVMSTSVSVDNDSDLEAPPLRSQR